MEHIISNGRHMLSGVGHATIETVWKEKVDADLFRIDGVTYAAYEDPSDGYRSYGGLRL